MAGRRVVEDLVDFGDEELNTVRCAVEQVEPARTEDSSVIDQSFLAYREEKEYDAESEDSNRSSHVDVSNPEYEADDRVIDPRYLLSNSSDIFYPGNEEDDDHETNSQGSSVGYPHSDASDSDENILASSMYAGDEENAGADGEVDEIPQPPSPMSTDACSGSEDLQQTPSPMKTDTKTDTKTEDIEMSGTHPVKSVNRKMSQTVALPVTSGKLGMSKTAPEPAPLVKPKSRTFSLVNYRSLQTPGSNATLPSPKIVVDFGVDTSNLDPLKSKTNMSEVAPRTMTPNAQDNEEVRPDPKPAPQTAAEDTTATDDVPQTNQDPPKDVPKNETASEETSVTPFGPLSFSKFGFDTKPGSIFTNGVQSSRKYGGFEVQLSPKDTTSSSSDGQVKDQSKRGSAVGTIKHDIRLSMERIEARLARQAEKEAALEQKIKKLCADLDKLNADFEKWWARVQAFSAKLDKYPTFYDLADAIDEI